jgi:Ca2+/Na+ antiporter
VSILGLVAAHREKSMLEQVEQRHLVSCVVAVVQRHFPVGRTVQISSTRDEDDRTKYVLEAMHLQELWPLQVIETSRASVLPSNVEKISSYIIFTRSVEDFTVQAEKLIGSSSWDSRGLFLILVTVKLPNSEELALSIVQEIWQIGRGYNVLVMVQQDTLLNLYTWFPYSSHDNCGDVKNVVLINQWVMEEEGKFVRVGSLFPYKTHSNFHGCPINLSTALNFEIEYKFFSRYFLTHNITRNDVNDFSDDTTSDEIILTCMKNLWNRESDMSFGAIPLFVDAISNSEPSFPYFVLKFSWFVACPKPFSRLQRIFHIFSPSVWISVAVVLFLVTVVSWCLAKQSNDIRSYANISSTLYNIWAVTVGASMTETPRSLRLKLFFVVFVWYCAAISTVFQTFLTSYFVDPGYDKQLKSLKEILIQI